MNDKSRRNFISKLALGTTAMAIPSKLKSSENNSTEKIILDKNALGFQWNTLDPFLFCVHHEDYYPKGNDQLAPDKKDLEGRNIGQDFVVKDGWRMYHGETVPGFPAHPHRGFETLTVVRRGIVDHADSHGASGRYGGGDVQWLTAGKGIQHSEMFPLVNKDKENTMELFQIWLNLPAKNKFAKPNYKMFWEKDIPKVNEKDHNNNNIQIELIAGEYKNIKAIAPPSDSWASDPNNHISVWIIKLAPNAQWTIPSSVDNLNRNLYFYEGDNITIDNQKIENYHSVSLTSNKDITIQNGNKDSSLLFLQGRPINEPVVQYGPFVMNSKEEIQQAFIDFQKDNFGGWAWGEPGKTHGTKERFAEYIK